MNRSYYNIIMFFTLSSILLVNVLPSSANLQLPDDDIKLDYTIDGGNVTETLYEKTHLSLLLKIDAKNSGQITIEIPRTLVDFVLPTCEPDNLIIIMNEDEAIPSNIVNTSHSRIITLDFPKGQNEIEFIGSYMLDVGIPERCGFINGYNSKFLPPKKQVNNGLNPEDILCNEGLKLIHKATTGEPACVSSQSIEKLMERGWAKSSL